jgi:transcriptional regulator with XRE-family HTH domain
MCPQDAPGRVRPAITSEVMDLRAPPCQHAGMSLRDPALPAAEGDAFAALLRRYRAARRMSQLDLALDCEVSARHLSFLETGRAKPSREMVLQIADGLILPLGSRNALLQAAGFAAVFPASPLDSEALGPFRAVLQEMMDRHAPWPAILATGTGACAMPMPPPPSSSARCRPAARPASSVC